MPTDPTFKSSAGVRFRRAFDYTATGFCVAFNAFLFVWGAGSVATSIWSLLQHSYIGSVLSIFLTLLFNLLMIATSIYGCRALGSKGLSKQIRYMCMAVILLVLFSILLASQSTDYIATQAITRDGANAYDKQVETSEYDVLHDYRRSFFGAWETANCSGGNCLVNGCLEDPVRFEPVSCTEDSGVAAQITADGRRYNHSHEYFLQCYADQGVRVRGVDLAEGMVNSLCYTREFAISSSSTDSLVVMILLAVAIGSMILAVISVIVLVSRPHTWQDDDFRFVSDEEMFHKASTSAEPLPFTVE
ncbi:hypothetical protein FOZ62_024441 [Perkinsus olseni]|uniref:Uncharacterized protein n=1 Tax=Perkinsus olseni TaxID=32597 RepID=A0A7J6TSG4_PEROL|nr:hypothetical protein FOZ62_024441 [Perkinsus olseni]